MYVISIFGTKLIGVFNPESPCLFSAGIKYLFTLWNCDKHNSGIFFQQTSGGANSFNFLVSIFIIGSMYTALTCYYWLEKINKNFMWLLVILIIVLTASRAIREWSVNLSQLINRMDLLLIWDSLKQQII